MKSFDINGLNNRQKEAVTHDEGPLLIVAGAGTGKTHVITSRILHLLLNKKKHHSSILALTFTEKACEEMTERIDCALPYSYDEIAIQTFHGFCNSILSEEALNIGLDTSYKVLTKIDQWMFIRRHLFEFDLDYYRPLGNPRKFISALASHFSRLKDEDISPAEYINYAKKLPENEEIEISEKKRILELAGAYEIYQNLLLKNNFLDFNDLNYYVLRLFEQCPGILEKYRNTFTNILVDEFQDTNYAQSKIVFMLAEKHQNLTVVADDDQSIYRWRGASMNAINEFEKRFSSVKKIVLNQNYRSTPQILNASYELIQNNNPHRLEHTHKIDKRLLSASTDDAPVSIHYFDNYFYENSFIAEKIIELTRKHNYSLNDFAILVRAHSHAKSIANELKRSKIQFHIRNRESIFALPEIKDLTAVLNFLANQNDSISLFRILTIEQFGIPIETVTKYMNTAKRSNDPLFEILKHGETDKNTKTVVSLLEKLIEFQRKHTVSAVVTRFLQESLYMHFLQKSESHENEEKIVHISDFLRMIGEFEQNHMNNSIYAFLDYLDLLEEADATLESPAGEDHYDMVQILSVHAAKGLEFPFVFIPSVVQTRFPGKNKREPIEIPDGLVKDDLPHEDMHTHEERRLFYVACTRAKKRLFISASAYYEGKKKWKPSKFIEEIKSSNDVEFVDHTKDSRPHDAKIINVVPESNITKKEISFKAFSFSKIDTFQRCPLKFKFRYVFKIPSPDQHAANFGTSIHNTLKEFYANLKNKNEVSPELLKNIYEKNWIPYGYESKAHENARKKRGYEMLKHFYEENESKCIIPKFTEKEFKLKIADYVITGRIDRIDELEDRTYELIDYKTGKLAKAPNLNKNLQLSIYALAGRDALKLPISKLSLYFIENNTKISTGRTDEQLKSAVEEIKSSADQINESNFKATPGFDCQYCEYRRICNKAEI